MYSSKNGINNDVIEEGAFESERLRLDADARKAMAETFNNVMKAEEDPKAWKWIIRKRVWDLMEALNIAQNPRPVHHRIPNFVGAQAAAKKVSYLKFIIIRRAVLVGIVKIVLKFNFSFWYNRWPN